MSDVHSRIGDILSSNDVVLFMKGTPLFPQCGFSSRAVAILDHLGLTYETVDVLQDQEIRQGIKSFSDWPTIPQLYIKGEFVGGSDIMMEMFEAGELHQMIQDAMAALTAEDELAARKVIAADDAVDFDFNAIKHTLAQEIAADPAKVDAALDLLMVIKYLERIGDHAVNVAEWVQFVRTGRYKDESMF